MLKPIQTIQRRVRVLPVLLLLFFMIASSEQGIAGGEKYVLYLKTGIIIRCLRYQHRDGQDYQVRLSRNDYIHIPEDMVYSTGLIHRHAVEGYELYYKYDSVHQAYVKLPDHYVHEHGFFFQWQVDAGAIDGMRVMMGYRINTYVAVGVGIGAEYGGTLAEPAGVQYPTNPNFAASFVYNSGYSPFLLYITGDFMKTSITPFYSVEVGYNLPWYPHLETDSEDGAYDDPYSYYTNYGGLTSGLGVGCRMYTRRRFNIYFSLNMNAGYVRIKTDGYQGFTNSQNNPVYLTTTSNYTMAQPSFRFGIGF